MALTRWKAGILVTVILAASSPAVAQIVGPDVSPKRPAEIDPKFRLLESQVARWGRNAPVFGQVRASVTARTDGAGALLRFDRVLELNDVVRLERATGMAFVRNDGLPVRLGTIYQAWVPFSAVATLAEVPHLVRAEVTWAPVLLRPLEVTRVATGAEAASLRPDGLGVDGSGVVVADIDSGVDILHPHLFFADAGYYPWIDANENGVFDPIVDAVDLDRDGVVDLNEKLRVLDGSMTTRDSQVENRDEVLQVEFDWLYADLNGDGTRNVGVAEGFYEEDPAYGEAIFVVDDADRDGVLDPEERLVRLGTSKIRRVFEGGQAFERGQNLIQATETEGFDDSLHGTGVSSILVGGQDGFHSRVGLAPGAELLMYSTRNTPDAGADPFNDSAQFLAIEDALRRGATLVLHEWTNPYSVAHDGSTNLEAGMDVAREQGVVQVNPLGNLNLADKHIERDLSPNQSTSLVFDVGPGFEVQGATRPYSIVYVSLYWQGEAIPDFVLRNPDGELQQVALNADPGWVGTTQDAYQATYEKTSRGTHHIFMMVWSPDWESQPVQPGAWTIQVENVTEETRLVGRVSDYYSGWSVGVKWAEATRDRGTMVYPSTADSAFGVAAYGGRWDDTTWDMSSVGELRNYSGRGPRTDGARGVDITAPDDPYAALAATDAFLEVGWGRSWFMTFGGTSGAGPHVAGAVALLRQQNPDWTPDQIETRLAESARGDALVPASIELPDIQWGYGKLDIWRALYDSPPPAESRRPNAVLEGARGDGVITLDASETTDPDGDALYYRFDADYDGVWETDWQEEPRWSGQVSAPDVRSARVEVRDATGKRHGAIAILRGAEPESDVGDASVDVGGTPQRPTPGFRDTGCAQTPAPHIPPSWPGFVVVLMGLWIRRCR